MKNPTDSEIAARLVHIISDGFNRSLGALEQAGAIDAKKLGAHYKGVGSKFYDIVTEQIEYTAGYGAPAIRQLFADDNTSA